MPQDTPPAASPEPAERWNVGRLLAWTADFLRRKGSESPRLEAEVLLAFTLGWERVKLYTRFEDVPDDAQRTRFRGLVKRRSEGSPVAYLVGHKEFFSITLAVTPDVLIPRPDSEFVVVEFLTAFKEVDHPHVADVGTGSGCLALACANNHKSATVVAIDISPEALKVAARNAASLGLNKRVSFVEGNLLEPVAGSGPFDAILSNPPYIKTGEIAALNRSVAAYEPHLALDGGPDGLAVIGPLIAQAVPLLKPGGLLLIEIGSDQEADVRALIEAQPGLKLGTTIRDHSQHPRVVKATRNASV